MINKYVSDGWTLQEIATPDDGMGAMIGVFYKEDRLKNNPVPGLSRHGKTPNIKTVSRGQQAQLSLSITLGQDFRAER